MDVTLILLLGGSGERFDSTVAKQYFLLDKQQVKHILSPAAQEMATMRPRLPVFEVTARQLLSTVQIDSIVIVSNEGSTENETFQTAVQTLQKDYPEVQFMFTTGGATRHLSFRNGLKTLQEQYQGEPGPLMVHDANRPYLSAKYLARIDEYCQRLTHREPCFIPVIPVTDSICRVSSNQVQHYEQRDEIFRIQTPQLLYYPAIADKIDQLDRDEFTDEGSFCKHLGLPVFTFAGDLNNTKITFKEDLQ